MNRHSLLRLAAGALALAGVALRPAVADVACPAPDAASIAPYVAAWQGTLGGAPIRLVLVPHADDPGRLQGSYARLAAGSARILLAGEPSEDGASLELEESANGEDVTGVLTLAFPRRAADAAACRRVLDGEWLDEQYSHPRSIHLERTVAW